MMTSPGDPVDSRTPYLDHWGVVLCHSQPRVSVHVPHIVVSWHLTPCSLVWQVAISVLGGMCTPTRQWACSEKMAGTTSLGGYPQRPQYVGRVSSTLFLKQNEKFLFLSHSCLNITERYSYKLIRTLW